MSQSLVPEEVFLFPSASFSASYGIIKLVEAELRTGHKIVFLFTSGAKTCDLLLTEAPLSGERL